jgi:hypothetical protein
MSDEYQPDEVIDSLPEPDMMPAEPVEIGSSTPEEAGETTGSEPALTESAAHREVVSPSAATAAPSPSPAVATVVVAAPKSTKAVKVPDADSGNGDHRTGKADAQLREPETEVDIAPSAEDVMAVEAPTESTPSSVISLADLEKPRRERARPERDEGDQKPSVVANALAGAKSLLPERRWIIGAVVGVLVIILLFLPPISLAQRLATIGDGYTTLDSQNPFIEHPDGLRVTRVGDDDSKVRIKLASIPRADFTVGSVSEALEAAVTTLPGYLITKSPYYTLDVKAKGPVAGVMTVMIPNEAEPWEMLDLYAWDGKAWRWLPTQLDREAETLVSAVDALPESVIVLQSQASMKRIAAETDVWPVEGLDGTTTEIGVSGLLIGTMGGTTGQAGALPLATEGAQTTVIPMVRNWLPGREPNWALVSDMLLMDAERQAHTTNLVNLTQEGGYTGLVVDYRQIQSQDRAAYAQFVSELGAAFDAAGLWLGVVVDAPQPLDDGTWDTGGYDWARLGAAAHQLRVVMPLSPAAYTPGGEAEQLMQWAIGQVERHKIMLVYSTLSYDGRETCGLDTVLASVGDLHVTSTLTETVLPGTKINVALNGAVAMERHPSIAATRVSAGGHDYWLGTPQWLAARMDLADRYLLGGVVLRDLFDGRNVNGLMPVVTAYQAGELSAVGDASAVDELSAIMWAVTDPRGTTSVFKADLSQPSFAWTAPAITGTYRLAATVAGLDRGSLDITVAAPAPVLTDTVATGDADEASVEEEEETADAANLKAAFVADVTVPDNTLFEKGEEFVKTWRMRNSGTEDWPADTVMVFASGSELAKVKEVEVGAVKAGDNVEISVEMQAPDENGSFRSVWQLQVNGKSIGGGGAYVLIRVGEPSEEPETPAAQPPAPRPVASGAFELGGHIRDMGIPYGDKMRYAGMNWVKIQVHYGQGADSAIAAAHARGFKIQLSAIGGASMVTQAGFADNFASWVAGLAAAGADAIEVWNEPNIDREWAIGHISPQAYTNLLCKSYAAIKAANRNTDVISAAPAPTGWFGGCGPNGCDDKPWMEGLYNAGAANCMDYIGAHHNSGATSPSARIGHPANPGDTHHSWFFLPQTELYYNIFRGSRKLVYTEMGYASQEGVPHFSDHFAWARGTNNAQQAAWLAEAVRLSINTGMVRCVIVWNVGFARNDYDPQDGYSIIRPGGGCPACDTLHAVLGTR